MSAIFTNTTAKVLSATTLTGVSSNGRILICAWNKWDNTALNSAQTITYLSETAADTTPHLELYYETTPHLVLDASGSTTAHTTTMVHSTWYSTCYSYGPWDGVSRAKRVWTNGSLVTANVAGTSVSVDLAALYVGRRNTAAAAAKGMIAEVGVWAGLTTGQEDTIVAEAQLYHVDLLSIAPNYSWRLDTTVAAATGGIALTNTGTVTFDGANNPTLGAPTSGTRFVASCFM